jgi:hypothetical protein
MKFNIRTMHVYRGNGYFDDGLETFGAFENGCSIWV